MAMRPTNILPTSDGTRTLYSHEYAQTFHSVHGARTEALHVYVHGCAVAQVLQEQRTIHILEIGFGAGLNFMLTAALTNRLGGTIRYTGLDQHLPDTSTLEELDYGSVTGLPALWESLIRWRGSFSGDVPVGQHHPLSTSNCQLELIVGDATRCAIPSINFDAIYLDAFDPQCNPDLWTESFLSKLYDSARPLGRLATYSVAGPIRRKLTQVGFEVERRPGPPGKRHCLVCCKPHAPSFQA